MGCHKTPFSGKVLMIGRPKRELFAQLLRFQNAHAQKHPFLGRFWGTFRLWLLQWQNRAFCKLWFSIGKVPWATGNKLIFHCTRGGSKRPKNRVFWPFLGPFPVTPGLKAQIPTGEHVFHPAFRPLTGLETRSSCVCESAPWGETSADAMCEVSDPATGRAADGMQYRGVRVLDVRREVQCGKRTQAVPPWNLCSTRISGERPPRSKAPLHGRDGIAASSKMVRNPIQWHRGVFAHS